MKMELRRHIGDYVPEADKYFPFRDVLAQYECSTLDTFIKKHYSLITGIEQLYKGIETEKIPFQEAEQIARAFLTDRGLLFAQTRERDYLNSEYSMRERILYHSWYKVEAKHKIYSPEYSYQLLRRRQSDFVDDGWPPFEEAHFFIALQLLKADEEIYGTMQLDYGENEPGYSKGDIARLKGRDNSDENQGPLDLEVRQKVELYMEKWADGVEIFFVATQKHVKASAYLREHVPFTTVELYVFLAYFLPEYLVLERRRRNLCNRAEYTPMIQETQLNIFEQQLADYRTFTWESWRKVLPMLQQFLHPDLEHFLQCECTQFGVLEPVVKRFYAAFLTYTKQTTARYPASGVKNQLKALSEYLVYNCSPFFLNRPEIVFYLFRSPKRTQLLQSNKGYSLKRQIQDALNTPISAVTLEADGALFREIVTACAEGCAQVGITFDRAGWEALWPCICQGVSCLQYDLKDLITYQGFSSFILRVSQEKWPLLDKQIRNKLMSKDIPFVFALYKTAYLHSWGAKDLSWYADKYSSLFARPAANQKLETKYQIIKEFSSSFGWNQIKIGNLIQDLHLALRNEAEARSNLQDVLAEWFLLQIICNRSWKYLLGAVCMILQENTKGPV